MWPDLGKYTFAVLASYGATLALLGGLVLLSLWQGKRVKTALQAAEQARAKGE